MSENTYTIASIEAVIGTKYREELLSEFLNQNYIKIATSVKALKQEIEASKILERTDKPSVEETRLLRRYLDAVMKEKYFARYFVTSRKETGVDDFYDEFADNINIVNEKMQIVTKYYNKIRNYVTKKTNDKDARITLCFGRPRHFEQAWQNKQEGKFGNVDAALLERDGKFYYIVPAAKNAEKLNFPIMDENSCMKSSYKYLYTRKSIKMTMLVPKLTFKSKAAIEGYKTHEPNEKFPIPIGNTRVLVSKDFYDNYNAGLFRKDRKFLDEVIDFYKSLLDKHNAFDSIDASRLKPTSEYKNLGEFCAECDAMNYNISTKYLDADIVDAAVESGNLLMFLITNQDMYKDREQMKNKYSIFLNEIFRCMNENRKSIIVNNNPKIFWRKALISPEDEHPIGSVLINKKTDDGKSIPDDVFLSLREYFNKKKTEAELSAEDKLYLPHVITKVSDRPHIKDAHYAREMFYIQMSYTLNKDVPKETMQRELNLCVREDIRQNGCNILAVCRGTDNLLYYYMTTTDGEKISAGPLNVVGETDFLDKLEVIGKIRKADQRDWIYDKTVTELKNTYLGMVTHVIADMAVKNNCIIVIDWISDRVKNKHARIDATVYKKFENILCKTLSCYADKNKSGDVPGSIINPLQLCVASDTNYYGQNGIVFFASAAYTKNICPSGYVSSLIDTYNKNTVISKIEFLSRMNRIWYDMEEECFKFEFTMRNLGTKLTSDEIKAYEGADFVWTVATKTVRLRYSHERKRMEEYDGTNILKNMFAMNKNITKRIDVSSLLPREVNALYETFIIYANGYIPKFESKESYYFSPVISWSNIGHLPYDEMTVQSLAEKGIKMYNTIIKEDTNDASRPDVEKMEWLNYLFKNGEKFRK